MEPSSMRIDGQSDRQNGWLLESPQYNWRCRIVVADRHNKQRTDATITAVT